MYSKKRKSLLFWSASFEAFSAIGYDDAALTKSMQRNLSGTLSPLLSGEGPGGEVKIRPFL